MLCMRSTVQLHAQKSMSLPLPIDTLLMCADIGMFCAKHHCRLCGRLHCSSCCDNYLEVTVLDPLFAVRVCNKCFHDVRETLKRRALIAATPTSVCRDLPGA
jgi:hypothetical protein